MSSAPKPRNESEEFAQAALDWDLERLYRDLAVAKKTWNPAARDHLTDVEKLHLRGLLCGYSSREIAEKLYQNKEGVTSALSKTIYRYVEVLTQREFNSLRFWNNVKEWLEADYKFSSQSVFHSTKHYWGSAPDITIFYGRTEELNTLSQSILQKRCRLITVVGLGGIGKTTLAVKLGQNLADKFDFLIWCSLHSAPLFQEMLKEVIQGIFPISHTTLDMSQLMSLLRQKRCLLILDNWDTLLASGQFAGQYREGYEEYGEFLKRVGKENHSSCVILTSREQPQEMSLLALEPCKVKSLVLMGLKPKDARIILAAKNLLDVSDWDSLIELYRGNPLALMIIAENIRYWFDGSVSQFLQCNTLVVDDSLKGLLNEQFERLSETEKEMMFWLAVAREPVSLGWLREKLLVAIAQSEFLKAIKSLEMRCLIEKIPQPQENKSAFTLQPSIMRYLTQKLVEQFYFEVSVAIRRDTLTHCQQFTRLQLVTVSEGDIYSQQLRLMVTPIKDQLVMYCRSDRRLRDHLDTLLNKLSTLSAVEVGYALENTQSLLLTLPTNP